MVDEENVFVGLKQAAGAEQMNFRQKLQTPMEVVHSRAGSCQNHGSPVYPLFLPKRDLSVNPVEIRTDRVG